MYAKTVAVVVVLIAFAAGAHAHFGVLIPTDDIVTAGEERRIELELSFSHPMERIPMQLERPARFGVMARGEVTELADTLKERKEGGFSSWRAAYEIARPGDHLFFFEPRPYWEPSEGSFIVHYTKVAVNALGLQTGWDSEVGLETEIVPLTRPYGLWTGNIFRGVVKVNGKPAPHAVVEVEYLNDGTVTPPSDPFVTQTVKADGNGVFAYAMVRAGWWGFAALSTAERTLKKEGKDYPVEIGAVMWVKTTDMQ